MSQQINLFKPALRKPRDWLTAGPLLSVAALVLVVILAASYWSGLRATAAEQQAGQREARLKEVQSALTALAKQAANHKPSSKLAAELAEARSQLEVRRAIVRDLKAGNIGSTTGFAEYLRGFAREVPQGLWLTGFTIGPGGSDMEIRGRMLDPAALPVYIRRLKGEQAFQGRSFASLTIKRPQQKKSGAEGAAAPGYVEFVLTAGAPAPAAEPKP